MNTQIKIKCPKCNTGIEVDKVLYNQIQSIKEKEFQTREQQLKEKENEFEQKKQNENQIFQERVNKELPKLVHDKTKNLRKEIEDEKSSQFNEMQKELNEKSNQIKELNKTKADNEKLKRENQEIESKTKLDYEQKFSLILQDKENEIRKSVEGEHQLQILGYQKQIDDQKKLTDEMQRKQNQGSIQLQGEVQELAIENYLKNKFPLDTIEEIGKGVKGGDCIQTVNTHEIKNCGKIYYESKRTKTFGSDWIEKFKNDMREKKIELGILVTETMPKDMNRMGTKEGVWICTFEEFKSLCFILREMVIKIKTATTLQENKSDKMNLLYEYLTSSEFKMQVEAIVEGYTTMRSQINKERDAMESIWKKREKQLDKVIKNTIDMYSSIQGIGGKEIQSIETLELPEGNVE